MSTSAATRFNSKMKNECAWLQLRVQCTVHSARRSRTAYTYPYALCDWTANERQPKCDNFHWRQIPFHFDAVNSKLNEIISRRMLSSRQVYVMWLLLHITDMSAPHSAHTICGDCTIDEWAIACATLFCMSFIIIIIIKYRFVSSDKSVAKPSIAF